MSPIGSRWQEDKLARSGHESQDEVNSYVAEIEVASGRSCQSLVAGTRHRGMWDNCVFSCHLAAEQKLVFPVPPAASTSMASGHCSRTPRSTASYTLHCAGSRVGSCRVVVHDHSEAAGRAADKARLRLHQSYCNVFGVSAVVYVKILRAQTLEIRRQSVAGPDVGDLQLHRPAAAPGSAAPLRRKRQLPLAVPSAFRSRSTSRRTQRRASYAPQGV